MSSSSAQCASSFWPTSRSLNDASEDIAVLFSVCAAETCSSSVNSYESPEEALDLILGKSDSCFDDDAFFSINTCACRFL